MTISELDLFFFQLPLIDNWLSLFCLLKLRLMTP